jgi:ABC-type transport system substrate-binding protein
VLEGIGTTDMKARKRTYDRLQMIWAEESWTVNLAFWVIPVVISQRVKSYRHPVDQVPHFAATDLSS